jgi:hypothetical protein
MAVVDGGEIGAAGLRISSRARRAIAGAATDMACPANLALVTGAVNPLQAVIRDGFAAVEAAGQGERTVLMLADFFGGGECSWTQHVNPSHGSKLSRAREKLR